MAVLRNHEFALYDEDRYNIGAGLADFWYARAFLRRIGKEERRRFSEKSWAYGDPSYYGGYSLFEVLEGQLGTILHALFGAGFSGELLHLYYPDDSDALALQEDLLASDGGPVYPHSHEGDSFYELLVAELRGSPEDIARLTRLLRVSDAEGSATRVFKWAPHTERAGVYGGRSGHIVLLYDTELEGPDETVRRNLFEKLIRAWEAEKRERHRPPQEGAQDGDRGRESRGARPQRGAPAQGG